jgi:hypothetical protein
MRDELNYQKASSMEVDAPFLGGDHVRLEPLAHRFTVCSAFFIFTVG